MATIKATAFKGSRRHLNLPGGGQVWKVGNSYFWVTRAPGTYDIMAWKFRNQNDLKAAFEGGKVRVDRRMSWNMFRKKGAVRWGFTEELRNTSRTPFSQFIQDYKREAMLNPMLKSKEVIAIFAQAIAEGREPTQAELETTKWWRSRTAEQRAWVQLASADPKTAEQIKRRNRLETRDALISAGYQGDPTRLAARLGDRFTLGSWTQQDLEQGIARMVDPFEPGANTFAGRTLPTGGEVVQHKKTGKSYYRYNGIDYLMQDEAVQMFGVWNPRKVGSVNNKVDGEERRVSEIVSKPFAELSALGKVDEVRDMVEEWLGPKFAAGWSNRAIEKWAHDLRDNENMKDKLEEELRRQRNAVLPGYDKNLTYEQIATPWRAVVSDVWGQKLKEDDPLFYQILKANDLEVAERMLRKEGRKRGVAKVQADGTRALLQSFGGQVAGVMGRG